MLDDYKTSDNLKTPIQMAHASGSLFGSVGFFIRCLFVVLKLFIGFLLDNQPRRKTILKMALTFLVLDVGVLRPKLFHQSMVIFTEPL